MKLTISLPALALAVCHGSLPGHDSCISASGAGANKFVGRSGRPLFCSSLSCHHD
jgi:hypothetical protein